MSNDVQCGFVMVENCQLIVRQKVQLIILGVAAQSLQELEAFADRESGVLSMDEWTKWKRIEVNLGYLVNLIAPMVLKLDIFEAIREPLKFETVMAAYRRTAESLRSIENYVCPTYEAETKLSKIGVEVEKKWMMTAGA